MSIAPGWYPDPDDAGARRYWDGQAWSAPLPADGLSDDVSLSAEADDLARRLSESRDLTERLKSKDKATRKAALAEFNAKRAAMPATNNRAALVCPHCNAKGTVTRKTIKVKKGVSGGKATGAVLTGGLSLLGTGLSRKETVTQMHCHACGTDWQV